MQQLSPPRKSIRRATTLGLDFLRSWKRSESNENVAGNNQMDLSFNNPNNDNMNATRQHTRNESQHALLNNSIKNQQFNRSFLNLPVSKGERLTDSKQFKNSDVLSNKSGKSKKSQIASEERRRRIEQLEANQTKHVQRVPIILYIKGRNLKNLDTGLKNKSDPQCQVFQKDFNAEKYRYIGHTEII